MYAYIMRKFYNFMENEKILLISYAL